jgi:hypothetical protein
MKSMIIKTEIPIAGGSEFRLQEGHGGCVEFVEAKSSGGAHHRRMEPEKVIVRIPVEKRAEIAKFFQS